MLLCQTIHKLQYTADISVYYTVMISLVKSWALFVAVLGNVYNRDVASS